MNRHLLAVIGLLFIVSSCASRSGAVRPPTNAFLYIEKSVEMLTCKEGVGCATAQFKISGSGFVVLLKGESSVALTAGHLCIPEDPTNPWVHEVITVYDITGNPYKADVLEVHLDHDICVLRVWEKLKNQVRMASSPPTRGDRVVAMSAPMGIYFPGVVPIFEGFYSGDITPPGKPVRGAYTLPTQGGSSGSAILDSNNRLIGLIIAKRTGFENFCISAQYSYLKELIERIRDEHFTHQRAVRGS